MTQGTQRFNIQCDFQRDLAVLILFYLKRVQPESTHDNSVMDVVLDWQRLVRQRAPRKPRRVLLSKEARSRYACPDGFAPAFDSLCERAKAGRNLFTYLSAYYQPVNFQNHILNEARVVTFHLGTAEGAHGLPDADGPLLYARVTASEFYVLGFGRNNELSNTTLIQILAENWPDLVPELREPKPIEPLPRDPHEDAMDMVTVTESLQSMTEIQQSAVELFTDFLSSSEDASGQQQQQSDCGLRMVHLDQHFILFSTDAVAAEQVPLFMMEIDKTPSMLS